MSKSRLVSGRVKKTSSDLLDPNRYDFLNLSNAEPDLGSPSTDNSFLLGNADGSRFWSDSVPVIDLKGDVFTDNIFSLNNDPSDIITVHQEALFNDNVSIAGNLTVQGITISESLFDNLAISGGLEVNGDAIISELYTTNVRSAIESGEITFFDTVIFTDPVIMEDTLQTGKNIEIGFNSLNAEESDGLGIKILGPAIPTTILYNSATDRLEINKVIEGSITDVDVEFAKNKTKVNQAGEDPLDLLIFYQHSSDEFRTVSVQDISGKVGFIGSQGATGFAGSKGDAGFTGSQGDVGFTGSQGDAGFVGSQGDIGFTGSQGDVGFTGSQGDAGFVGSQGVGFTGSQGFGFTGSQGDTGFTGSRGANGNRSVMLAQEGLLVVRTGTVRWYAPADLDILEITFRLIDPADQQATIVINRNGSAVRTLTMPVGQTKVVNSNEFTLSADDYLTVDVTNSGSPGLTTQGSGLNVVFLYQFLEA